VRARGYRGQVGAIGYGVDQDTFRPSADQSRTESSPDGFRIGYVGRLVEEKGLDDAIDAIRRAHAPVSLAIMGEGPHEARLRERVAELGLAERVTFQGWGQPDDVADFIRSLDALILLTRTTKAVREQFGRVIVEAQSCGVPVIGSECGAIPSVIGDGGWVVPESDPVALATLLDAVAADPQERRYRSMAGRKNVAVRFTYEAVADALAQSWFTAAAGRTGRMRAKQAGVDGAGRRRAAPSHTDLFSLHL
jgi:glycosyltransferase involved in cell wall biosynthesis